LVVNGAAVHFEQGEKRLGDRADLLTRFTCLVRYDERFLKGAHVLQNGDLIDAQAGDLERMLFRVVKRFGALKGSERFLEAGEVEEGVAVGPHGEAGDERIGMLRGGAQADLGDAKGLVASTRRLSSSITARSTAGSAAMGGRAAAASR
jgi:hypothetical protein